MTVKLNAERHDENEEEEKKKVYDLAKWAKNDVAKTQSRWFPKNIQVKKNCIISHVHDLPLGQTCRRV